MKTNNYNLYSSEKNSCDSNTGGIYIHIPFCVRKCDYCNFYSVTDFSLIPEFLHALIREMEIRSSRVHFPCDTLYLGGGTPSVLKPEDIRRILDTAFQCFDIHPNAEITLEANPGTVSPETLREFRNIGVNRINIGVQSFSDENLRFLGRIHTAQEALFALVWAEKAGFENIGLDLIYALPEQSEKDWRLDMEHALGFAPAHLSCYMLSYESGTLLTQKMEKGLFSPLAEQSSGNLFEFTAEFLESKGYAQYEISNFARSPDLQSRHNRKYWSFAPYIGLGPAAHSFFPRQRCWNCGSVTDYIAFLKQNILPEAGKELLTSEQEMMEAVYVGLRKKKGILIREFEKRFAVSFDELFGKLSEDLKNSGFLEDDAARCALSLRGMRFLDSITSLFADQIPEDF
ncbi:MAG: radical SAM family heme chaperone HemW [Desulfococcaceae bacterium]